MYLCPVAPVSKPLQAVDGSGTRPILQTNPATVARLSEMPEDVAVIQFSGTVWLIAMGNLHKHHTAIMCRKLHIYSKCTMFRDCYCQQNTTQNNIFVAFCVKKINSKLWELLKQDFLQTAHYLPNKQHQRDMIMHKLHCKTNIMDQHMKVIVSSFSDISATKWCFYMLTCL